MTSSILHFESKYNELCENSPSVFRYQPLFYLLRLLLLLMFFTGIILAMATHFDDVFAWLMGMAGIEPSIAEIIGPLRSGAFMPALSFSAVSAIGVWLCGRALKRGAYIFEMEVFVKEALDAWKLETE